MEVKEKYSKEVSKSPLDMIIDYILYRDLKSGERDLNSRYSSMLRGESVVDKSYGELELLGQLKNVYRNNANSGLVGGNTTIHKRLIHALNRDKVFLDTNKLPPSYEKDIVNDILYLMKDTFYKKELNRLREGFFSNLKHEFRTPLNMIFSSIQLLEQKCNLCNSCNCKKCFIDNLNIINTNSLRILKLSNNFVDLSRAQSGCMDFTPRNYEIINFVESICESINEYKKFNDIKLIFDTKVEDKIVKFDRNKLERVIINLISNAIKFNIQGGTILVSIALDNDNVNISIKDTGIGIDKDKLDSIFETFSNVEERFTKICEGSSVGLALSNYLIDMHGGTISVESEKGKGSKFTISIPNRVGIEEDIDFHYDKIDTTSVGRIEMEFSDIYS